MAKDMLPDATAVLNRVTINCAKWGMLRLEMDCRSCVFDYVRCVYVFRFNSRFPLAGITPRILSI